MSAAQKQKIGLMGGTFDPPHRGHLAAAKAAASQLGLDHVFFVVAGTPWQKFDERVITSAELRAAMTQAMLDDEGDTRFSIDDREIRRGGMTYTIDTLEEFRHEFTQADLYLIVGQDTAQKIETTWHRSDEIFTLAQLAVVTRREGPLQTNDLPSDCMFIEMKPIEISSSRIRDMIERGESIDDVVTPSVSLMISECKLYRGQQ